MEKNDELVRLAFIVSLVGFGNPTQSYNKKSDRMNTYIYRPGEAEMFVKLKSVHVEIPYSIIIVGSHEVYSTTKAEKNRTNVNNKT